jgi:hypothetical protein
MTDHIEGAYRQLEDAVAAVRNETELKFRWMDALQRATGELLDTERARVDSSFNNVLIEFKGKGKFGGSITSPAFREALHERLALYIPRASEREGLPVEDYIGFAIDGEHVARVWMVDGVVRHGPLLPVTARSFNAVVEAITQGHRRAFTADNLAEDFGHRSSLGRAAMQALADALAEALASDDSRRRKVQMLFEEWKALYGQASDLGRVQRATISRSLGFEYHGRQADTLAASLFVAHTFHSLLIKLISAEVCAAYGLGAMPSINSELAVAPVEELLTRLEREIERGAFFSAVGLRGFVEEAIFSWYLDAARADAHHHERIGDSIVGVVLRLAIYRFDHLQATGRSRDVLRDLYQALVPGELRKSLGEFYTPDWLIEHTVNRTNVADWLNVRVLDPTCGSGAFLLEVIARKRAAATAAGWDAPRILEMLTQNVWGFDLNPLAVQTARANFLIACADLLAAAGGTSIEVPVLLADAVYSPAPDPEGPAEIVEYRIGGPKSDLTVTLPADLARDRAKLDRVFEVMTRSVDANESFDEAQSALVRARALSVAEMEAWRVPIQTTYARVLDLHGREWNGIWFRIVRNFFWSATAGWFDLVVGNPPWVRWSNLPEVYRNRAKKTCDSYGIFSETRFFGGNELDIAAIITYTAADKWLRLGGRLAFVITQSVFQSPSSQGFRRFRLPGDPPSWLVPVEVEDLKNVKPFDAANKTAVVVMEKRNVPPKYPVPYAVWDGLIRTDRQGNARIGRDGRPMLERKIDPAATLAAVLARAQITPMHATPIVGEKSGAPWAILQPGRHTTLRGLFGESGWVNARKGITTDLNGVYFVEVLDQDTGTGQVLIRTRPNEGKTAIGGARQFWIEADLLYPLLKGAADFSACRLAPAENICALVPNHGIDRAALEEAATRVEDLPRTRAFFEHYESVLRQRSTYRTRMGNAPAWAIYNVGTYTFAPFKVVWPEMSRQFYAAVATAGEVPLAGTRPYVPDHKVFFVAFDTELPAYYLCGLMNAPVFREIVESHVIGTQMGDVLKHVNLPEFDEQHELHVRLARAVSEAHRLDDSAAHEARLERVHALADAILLRSVGGGASA